jgi:ppGpp synthetase/RelA/SpoT-type nucleotidyltranferase
MLLDFDMHRQKAMSDYSAVRGSYERFCQVLESILKTALKDVRTHQVSARAKTLESFARKATKPSREDPGRPKYPEPLSEITDLAAVRVIAFVLGDLQQIEDVVAAQFDRVERTDKGDRLLEQGTVGYRSVHSLVKLKPDRSKLLEYQEFEGLVAEIQVRTILQHAWAEIEHDIRYKSDLEVHKELSQRFAALAGLIEIGDREFDKVIELDAARRKKVRELAQLSDATQAADEGSGVAPEAQTEVADPFDVIPPEQGPASVDISPRDLLAQKRYDEAIQAYNGLIASQPQQFAHYLGRAKARFLSGDAKGALDDLNTSDALSPSNPLANRVRQLITGEVAPPLRKVEDSAFPDMFDSAAQTSPSTTPAEVASHSHSQETLDAFAIVREGHSALENGNYALALERYERAEDAGFSPVFALFNRAMVRCAEGTYDLCIHTLGRLRPFPGTALELHVMALFAICRLLQGGRAMQYLPQLAQRQLQLVETINYSYTRSPLRYLERALQQHEFAKYEKTKGVFGVLSA